jgi:predicted alpha/beta-hydrolase family hydrolase
MSGPEERLSIATPSGDVSAAYLRPAKAWGSIVVAHGAGAGLDHPFLAGFARGMGDEGVAALRVNFPYMESGRRSPDRPPVAVATLVAAFQTATKRARPGEPVWMSGKSFGGRMASVAVSEGLAAAGLVFLGYPLHPPGKPDRVRDEHLYAITVPMLFLQGTNDPFATPAVLKPVIKRLGKRATLHAIEGGGHSFEVRGTKRDARETGASLAAIAAAFLRDHAGH